MRGTKTEHATVGTTRPAPAQTDLAGKQGNVTIRGLQANVSVPKVSCRVSGVFLKGENILVVLAFVATNLNIRNMYFIP